ncbi:MAG TPA: hypothetical protein VMF89_31250, partial [Polyangiales bacterium]|nr:hypothetical protein [Polyangiales bacterium]
FVRLLGYAAPQDVAVGEPINIPGEVIAVRDTTLYTRDFVWKEDAPRTMVARLELNGDRVELHASRVFDDRQVSRVRSDGAGHILVSHHSVNDASSLNKLSVLNDQDLSLVSEVELGAWALFTDAKRGRALFQVSGGLLVLDVRDAAQPRPQAFFPSLGWPSDVAFDDDDDGDSILFAAGFYGIHRLDADVFNLLTP